MPVWNPRRDWLHTAVHSALGQQDCEFELVVVDDGCPTPVSALLEGLQDPALRVLRVAHGGPSHARNAGASQARGRLLRFIDADDAYDPHSSARLAGLLDADNLIAYGSTVFCDAELRPVWTMSSNLKGYVAVEALLGRFAVRIQSMMFPRAVVEAAGPWDTTLSVCEDLDFIVRATYHARVCPDPDVATYYRKHAGSLSSDAVRGDLGVRRVAERYFERHPEQRGTGLERRAAAARHAIAARAHASRRELTPAIRRVVTAMRLDPSAVGAEAASALPAVRGHLRHAAARRHGSARRMAQPAARPPPSSARSL